MPTNGYDVVVDEYVLSSFVSGSVLENIVTSPSYFIGKTFKSNIYNYQVKISGICRKKSPTIYAYEGLNFAGLESVYRVRVIDIDYAKTLYPELANMSIAPGHCLRNLVVTSSSLSSLPCDGTFENIPYDNIINKSDFDMVKVMFSGTKKQMYVTTDGSKEAYDSYVKLTEKVINDLDERGIKVKIEVNHLYEEQRNVAVNDLNNILYTVTIVAFVILGLALILIVLSTYLSMLNQISDIAVYRSLGYSRSFLGMIYLMELAMIAFMYTFIGGLATCFAMFIADIIPLISYSISTPFGLFILAMLGLALGITLIGILPVIFVFRLTPASIYSRYNRKINNE